MPASVAVATAKTGDLDIYIDALGTAVPLNSVLVRSRVDGELMRVHFSEGQDVKAGDLLAEIDPRPFTVQLAQARGKLARDEALLKNARTDVERYQTLWFAVQSIADVVYDAGRLSLSRPFAIAFKTFAATH